MRIGFASVLAMLAAAPVLAAPSTRIKVETSSLGVDATLVDSTTGGAQSVSGSPGPHTYFASAAPGVLKVQASTLGPFNFGACCTQLVNGIGASVSFSDVITVNAPGLTSGSFVATILIDGALSSAAAGAGGVVAFSNSETRVEVAGLADPVFSFQVNQSNYNGFVGGSATLTRSRLGAPYAGPLTGAFTFTIPFENLIGQTVTITQSCGANARTFQQGDSSSSGCDYSHTITWGGINQVLDENGTPVSNFTALGSNGTNYAQAINAVPEPSSWAMLIAGFGLVGSAARRQKRAQRA
ncbi:PEPxxWA-CTERM sorting domain-containing protein [Sandarakinorhabdus sp.]|jgi:hypothetical protein|uniref:PEPxxWA-CTERM sorting domain-containing protein n=1 Tax=Sandarakinorhabdus sp. TaxID=1916663 RepID=UPI003342764F